ncbi:MAG: alpha/beta hydrolase-fold protein [Chloroflexota bacterium]
MAQRKLVTPLLLLTLWIAACSSPTPQDEELFILEDQTATPEQLLSFQMSWTLQDTPTPVPVKGTPTSSPKPGTSKALGAALSLPTASRTPAPTRTPAISRTPTYTNTPKPTSTATSSLTPTNSPTPKPTSTVTRSPTPLITRTPSPNGYRPCHESNGQLVAEKMYSRTMQDNVMMRVYLPPCYKDMSEERFPVIYLAHGMFQDESAWTDLGAPTAADAMIADNQLPPFIMVMPAEEGLTSPFGYVLANEIVPYIDSHYRTIADRRYRAVGGFSRGASWAMHVTFRYPSIFSKLAMHSIGSFDQDDFNAWIKKFPADFIPDIYIDVGDKDMSRAKSEGMDHALTQSRIAHEFHLNEGDHNRAYWAANVRDYLRWYSANW